MIIVKVDLLSARTGQLSRIAEMHICNDGETTRNNPKRGSYNFKIFRKGTDIVTRVGRVENFPRKSYVIWRLVLRVLKKAFPEER